MQGQQAAQEESRRRDREHVRNSFRECENGGGGLQATELRAEAQGKGRRGGDGAGGGKRDVPEPLLTSDMFRVSSESSLKAACWKMRWIVQETDFPSTRSPDGESDGEFSLLHIERRAHQKRDVARHNNGVVPFRSAKLVMVVVGEEGSGKGNSGAEQEEAQERAKDGGEGVGTSSMRWSSSSWGGEMFLCDFFPALEQKFGHQRCKLSWQRLQRESLSSRGKTVCSHR
eukprot:761583-Hanusia_phi.AAC.4